MRNLIRLLAHYMTTRGQVDVGAMRRIAKKLADRSTQVSIIQNRPETLIHERYQLVINYRPQGSDQRNHFFLITVNTAHGRRIGAIEFRPRRGRDSQDKLADLRMIW